MNPPTLDAFLATARSRLDRLTPAAARDALETGACLVDIRGDHQIATDGEIDGALMIARNVLEWRLAPGSLWRHPQAPAPDVPIILLCNEGYQSSLAAATLQDLGLRGATDVVGGFQRWRADGLPVMHASDDDRTPTSWSTTLRHTVGNQPTGGPGSQSGYRLSFNCCAGPACGALRQSARGTEQNDRPR